MIMKVSRRREQQLLEQRLPVFAISAQVSDRPPRRPSRGGMHGKIGTTIKRARQRTAIEILHDSQRGTSGEGKIKIEARNQTRRDIINLAIVESGERDGSIDVVESRNAGCARGEPFPDRNSIGNIRSQDYEVGIAHQSRVTLRKFNERSIQADSAVFRIFQVAMLPVPRHVALKKCNGMTEIR